MFALHGVDWVNPVDPDRALSRVDAEDRPVLLAVIRRASQQPGPVSGRYRFTTNPGAKKVFAFTGEVETAPGAGPRRVTGYALDVTDQTRRAGVCAVRAAIRRRHALEQGKAALVARYAVDEATAFDVLAGCSTRHHLKLARLAAGVADRLGPGNQAEEPNGTLEEMVEAIAAGKDHLRHQALSRLPAAR